WRVSSEAIGWERYRVGQKSTLLRYLLKSAMDMVTPESSLFHGLWRVTVPAFLSTPVTMYAWSATSWLLSYGALPLPLSTVLATTPLPLLSASLSWSMETSPA